LAFWENVGLGILSLVTLAAYYYILSNTNPTADMIYSLLSLNSPSLFSSNLEALGLVGIGILERFSSALIHIAWGYLCIMAVLFHKKSHFLIALPMGFIDFLVPFAGENVVAFEALFFALAVASVFVAWFTTKELRKHPEMAHFPASQTPKETDVTKATLSIDNSRTL
jgi:hypothetical protein